MTLFLRIVHAFEAARPKLITGSFVAATMMDAARIEELRVLVLALYLVSFLAEHIGA